MTECTLTRQDGGGATVTSSLISRRPGKSSFNASKTRLMDQLKLNGAAKSGLMKWQLDELQSPSFHLFSQTSFQFTILWQMFYNDSTITGTIYQSFWIYRTIDRQLECLLFKVKLTLKSNWTLSQYCIRLLLTICYSIHFTYYKGAILPIKAFSKGKKDSL